MNAPLQFFVYQRCFSRVSPQSEQPLTSLSSTLRNSMSKPKWLFVDQQTYIDTHPAIAIFRCATEGSHTRNGGVIQQGTGPLAFKLENGRSVRGALKGDYVLYADGSTAQIITGAGQVNNDVALVGSVLSNGDEIINTPQDGFVFIAREGVSMVEDFLPSIAD